MRSSWIIRIAAVIVMLCGTTLSAFSIETVREPSTKFEFPLTSSFQYQGADHVLTLTGLTRLKVIFFKIYAVAHYMEDVRKTAGKKEAFEAVLDDGKSKELVIAYVRNLKGSTIQKALRKGFRKNTTRAEYEAIRPLAERLYNYFDTRRIRKNDRTIFRWLDGGTVIAIYNGDKIAEIKDPAFARALWLIWLGDKSVVNEDKLIARMVSSA